MSKKPEQKTKFGKRKVTILTIVILIIIVISALLYSSRTFLSKVAPVKFIQAGPIILAAPNHIYNVTLNKTSYKVYELSIPKNSSSSYVATKIIYTVKSNSTVVSLLLTESQLNLFRNETIKESMFNTVFYSNNSIVNNVFIENASSNNITLFLVVFPQNSTSNIAFNYTMSFITHLNSFNSLSLPNGGFGVIRPNNVISIKVPFEVTNISTIYLYGLSNQTIIYSIFDNSTNKTVYLSKPVTVLGNQTNEYISIKNLTQGSYSIILFNKHNSSILYDFWYTESPYIVNPYIYSRGNNAEGLVSYGISNQSGILSAYTINTSTLEGFLNLSSLYVYNSSQSAASHFLSAQLNGVLVVTNKNGTIQTYWVQNVAQIYTVNRFYNLVDNLWGNDITNKTIEGSGHIYYDNISKESYYAYVTNSSYYNYPFSFALQSTVSVWPNRGIDLSECYQPLQNGKNLSVSINGYCYDNIFINDSNVASAKFMISGSNYPITTVPYYDAEFVIGGGFNGSLSTIQNLNATLGLYYYNNFTSSYVEFPSYYSFSDDTAEEISNVNVKYNHNYATLEAGNNNEVYLGNSSRFMPLININNVNLTEEVTYFVYPTQNYSFILNGFSTSAGNYYNYGVVTTGGSSTCTITGFKSLTPGIYLTNVNITLPYTLTSGSTLNWQFTIFTNPFYNYTGNLNILEYENC
ncbi:MAG: thermopsin family protease [Candidatus Rehaiarchaeum fermentans]|nr:thermopsin [Candidatus Rehaiarchaeum fermentans]